MSLRNIFTARPLQFGRAGAGIFSNPVLNRNPVSRSQGQWNINKATEEFGDRADIEKGIRGQMGAGQSFGKTHKQMADTLEAQAGSQRGAAAAAADFANRQKNVEAQLQSAKAQSDALTGWQRAAASQRQQMTAPIANALAGLGTNVFGSMADVAQRGFNPTPNLSGQMLSGPMQQGASYTGTQMSAPTTSAQFANVGRVNAGQANTGRISAGGFMSRANTV